MDPQRDNFKHEPSAGVHFVVFNPSGDDFERNRLAMDGVLPDGTKLSVPPGTRAQGFNSILTTTHRQNFLVPPRRHRACFRSLSCNRRRLSRRTPARPRTTRAERS